MDGIGCSMESRVAGGAGALGWGDPAHHPLFPAIMNEIPLVHTPPPPHGFPIFHTCANDAYMFLEKLKNFFFKIFNFDTMPVGRPEKFLKYITLQGHSNCR